MCFRVGKKVSLWGRTLYEVSSSRSMNNHIRRTAPGIKLIVLVWKLKLIPRVGKKPGRHHEDKMPEALRAVLSLTSIWKVCFPVFPDFNWLQFSAQSGQPCCLPHRGYPESGSESTTGTTTISTSLLFCVCLSCTAAAVFGSVNYRKTYHVEGEDLPSLRQKQA